MHKKFVFLHAKYETYKERQIQDGMWLLDHDSGYEEYTTDIEMIAISMGGGRTTLSHTAAGGTAGSVG